MTKAKKTFAVAMTADFSLPTGGPRYPTFDLHELRSTAGVRLDFLAEDRPAIGPDQLGGVHGLIVLSPKITADTVTAASDLLAIGRFGVGFDSVDVAACTAADVAVFIAAGAVDRSVAEATLAWMLSLTHHVLAKDRLVRDGRWDGRSQWMGCELRGRTLGIVGLGGIGRALVELVRGLGMNPPIAYDPIVDPAAAQAGGVTLVPLDELMSRADFVSIHCPLNDETRMLIGPRELGLMKPGSYLINTARGGIVDEEALFDALAENRIAAAAIDCFAQEPFSKAPRLAGLDNVLLAPHCIAWTDELFRDIGQAVSARDDRSGARQAAARGGQPAGLRAKRLSAEMGSVAAAEMTRRPERCPPIR